MNKPPAGFRGPAAQLTNGDPVSVARTPDSYRSRRIRRALDRHAQPLPALVLVDHGDCWHDGHLDLGVPERGRAGRELAHAGWCP